MLGSDPIYPWGQTPTLTWGQTPTIYPGSDPNYLLGVRPQVQTAHLSGQLIGSDWTIGAS